MSKLSKNLRVSLLILVALLVSEVYGQIPTTGGMLCGLSICTEGQRCNNPIKSQCQDVKKQGLLGFALFLGIFLLSLLVAVLLVPPKKRIGKPYIAPVDTEQYAIKAETETFNLFGSKITQKSVFEFVGTSTGQLNLQYDNKLHKLSVGNLQNQIKYSASLNSVQRIVITTPDSQNKFIIVDENVSQVVTPKQEYLKLYTENRTTFSVIKGKSTIQSYSFDPARGSFTYEESTKSLRYNGKVIGRFIEGYVPVEILIGVWILEDQSHDIKQTLQYLDNNSSNEAVQKDWLNTYEQHLLNQQNSLKQQQLKEQQDLLNKQKTQQEQEELLRKQKEQEELLKKQKIEEEARKKREIELEQERLLKEMQLESQKKLDIEKQKLQKELDEKNRIEKEKNDLKLKRENIYKMIDEILKDGKMTEAERIQLHNAEMECPPERCKRKSGKGQYSLLCKKCDEEYKKTCIICKKKGLSEVSRVIALNCTVHQDQVHTPLPDYCSLCRQEIVQANKGGFGYCCLKPCSQKDQCASIC